VGESVSPPVGLWGVSAVCAAVGMGSALVAGGSLWGYGFGTVGTVGAVCSLFIDRTRQMSPDYDYGKKWFRKGVTSAYWLGTAGVLLHMIRYAILVGSK
jgi:hypothetical protein